MTRVQFAGIGLLLVLSVFLQIDLCKAQTQPAPTSVSGDITADKTWSGSYLVTGTIRVKNGATLTISRGTFVQFGKPAKDEKPFRLIVEDRGTLSASGTRDKPITFTSRSKADAAPSNPGDWGGIELEADALPGVLKCLIIEYADIGIRIFNNSSVESSIVRFSSGALTTFTPPRQSHHVRTGIYLAGNGSSAVGNYVYSCTWGIHVNQSRIVGKRQAIVVNSNCIALNSIQPPGLVGGKEFDVPCGIHVHEAVVTVTNNVIIGNTWGVEIGFTHATLTDNLFVSNDHGFVWFCEPTDNAVLTTYIQDRNPSYVAFLDSTGFDFMKRSRAANGTITDTDIPNNKLYTIGCPWDILKRALDIIMDALPL